MTHPVHQVLVGVHYANTFKFGAPELVLVISPSSGLEIMHLFLFLDSLIFEEFFDKISELLSTGSIGWHLAQPVHWVFHG